MVTTTILRTLKDWDPVESLNVQKKCSHYFPFSRHQQNCNFHYVNDDESILYTSLRNSNFKVILIKNKLMSYMLFK